ncbi:MAG: hypothetical protein ACKO0Z_06670 [Betaproteobacteria bacterium]
MALKSWLASLKVDVSNVSDVQAPIHADLGRHVTETADVSGVSGRDGKVASDTAETARESQAYQANPNIHAGCTADTAETRKKVNTEAHAEKELLSGELLNATRAQPKRLLRKRGLWLTGAKQSAARSYHEHHFNCPKCIAAGLGSRYGQRCGAGMALWHSYFLST